MSLKPESLSFNYFLAIRTCSLKLIDFKIKVIIQKLTPFEMPDLPDLPDIFDLPEL